MSVVNRESAATSTPQLLAKALGMKSPSGALVSAVDPEGPAMRTLVPGDNFFAYTVPCEQSPGGGESPIAVSAIVGGLLPATAYHVRLVAQSSAGNGIAAERTFETAGG